MSILGDGSTAGSLFIPNANGFSLHIDPDALQANEEAERRKDDEKQAEQLRQLICEELDDDLLSDDDEESNLSQQNLDNSPPHEERKDVYDDTRPGAGPQDSFPRHGRVHGYQHEEPPANQRDYYEQSQEDHAEENQFRPIHSEKDHYQDHNWNNIQPQDEHYFDTHVGSYNEASGERNGFHSDFEEHGETVPSPPTHFQPAAHYSYNRLSNGDVDSSQKAIYQPMRDGSSGGHEDQERDSMEIRQIGQLQILYKARGRRLEEVTHELEILKEESSREIRILKHQKNLIQEDNVRLKETTDSLEVQLQDSQQESVSLQNQIHEVNSRLEQSESSKSLTVGRLQATEEEINILRQQLEELACSETLSRAKREHEEIVAGMSSRYKQEVDALKQKVEKTLESINDKNNLCTRLQAELDDVTRTHERALMERAETINRLSRSLEDSQRQCRNLLESGSVAEIGQLKLELRQSQASKKISEQLSTTLQNEVTDLKEQLDLIQSASKLGVGETVMTQLVSDADDTIRKNLNFETPELPVKQSVKLDSDVDVQNAALRAELERALKTIKQKRGLIDELQKEMEAKDIAAVKLKDDFNLLERTTKELGEKLRISEEGLESPLNQENFMSAREQILSRQVSQWTQKNEELENAISTLQNRLDELILSEERLMSINQDLNEQQNVKENNYEEREKRSVQAARDTCIAFHESAELELKNCLLKDADEQRFQLENQITELREQLDKSLKEVTIARQNYVKLSRDSREETKVEIQQLLQEKDKIIASFKTDFEDEKLQMQLEKQSEHKVHVGRENDVLLQQMTEEWENRKQVWEEDQRKRIKNDLQGDVEAKYKDRIEKLKTDADKQKSDFASKITSFQEEIEHLRTQLLEKETEFKTRTEHLEKELQRLKDEGKLTLETVKREREKSEKEKYNSLNSERIKLETKHQIHVHELMSQHEENMAKVVSTTRQEWAKNYEEELKKACEEIVAQQQEHWIKEKLSLEAEVQHYKNAIQSSFTRITVKDNDAISQEGARQPESDQDMDHLKLKLEEKSKEVRNLIEKLAADECQNLKIKADYEETLNEYQSEMRRKSMKLKSVDALVEDQLKSLRLDLEQDFQRGLENVALERDKNAKLYREKEEELTEAREELNKWQKASSIVDQKFNLMVKQYEDETKELKTKLEGLIEENREMEHKCLEYQQWFAKYEEKIKVTEALEQSAQQHSKQLENLKKKLEDLKKGHQSRMEKAKKKFEAEKSYLNTKLAQSEKLKADFAIDNERHIPTKASEMGKELADQYIAALNKIKSDVLEYITKLKEHHARVLQSGTLHERKKTTKALRKYYLDGVQQICKTQSQVQPNENKQFVSQLSCLLDNAIDSLLASPLMNNGSDTMITANMNIENILDAKFDQAKTQTYQLSNNVFTVKVLPTSPSIETLEPRKENKKRSRLTVTSKPDSFLESELATNVTLERGNKEVMRCHDVETSYRRSQSPLTSLKDLPPKNEIPEHLDSKAPSPSCFDLRESPFKSLSLADPSFTIISNVSNLNASGKSHYLQEKTKSEAISKTPTNTDYSLDSFSATNSYRSHHLTLAEEGKEGSTSVSDSNPTKSESSKGGTTISSGPSGASFRPYKKSSNQTFIPSAFGNFSYLSNATSYFELPEK